MLTLLTHFWPKKEMSPTFSEMGTELYQIFGRRRRRALVRVRCHVRCLDSDLECLEG